MAYIYNKVYKSRFLTKRFLKLKNNNIMTKLIITLIAVYVFTLAYIYLLKIVFDLKGVKRIAYVPILNTLVCVVFPLYSVLNFISKKIN